MDGPIYIRAGRSKVPVLGHKKNYTFQTGKAEVRRKGADVTIVACGVLVSEADKAAELLAKQDIDAAVLNMASIKPIDKRTLVKFAKTTGAVVSCEEHNVIGGLGSAVAETLAESHPVPIERIGMKDEFGQSGPAEALLDYYKMRAKDIVRAVKKVIKRKPTEILR